jgi:hypothetical protein
VTFQEKLRCNARSCYTENNLSLATKIVSDCIIEEGFASACWTIEEKEFWIIVFNAMYNNLKGSTLFLIEH